MKARASAQGGKEEGDRDQKQPNFGDTPTVHWSASLPEGRLSNFSPPTFFVFFLFYLSRSCVPWFRTGGWLVGGNTVSGLFRLRPLSLYTHRDTHVYTLYTSRCVCVRAATQLARRPSKPPPPTAARYYRRRCRAVGRKRKPREGPFLILYSFSPLRVCSSEACAPRSHIFTRPLSAYIVERLDHQSA